MVSELRLPITDIEAALYNRCRALGKCQWPRQQNVSGVCCGLATAKRDCCRVTGAVVAAIGGVMLASNTWQNPVGRAGVLV
jgi:hypothetical protein